MDISSIVIQETRAYAKPGLNNSSVFMANDDDTRLTVITYNETEDFQFISLLVNRVGDSIIIDVDQNDKPLVDALVQAGIPRSQIILAYAGEPIPEST